MINQKIRKLRENRFSLREISKKICTSYGQVQRVCSNVEMSKRGLKRYSRLNGLKRNVKFKCELNEPNQGL